MIEARPLQGRAFFHAGSLALAASLAACANIGPSTLPDDRLAYTLAVAQSLEEQLLLNIVRTRYAEAPTFVDVSQIVAGYEYVREANVSSEFHFGGNNADSFVGPGGVLRLTEKPTMSYAPLGGESFARTLVVPVPPHMVLLLIQAGWRADVVLNLCVRSINGYRNTLPRIGGEVPADPEFPRIAQLLRKLQDTGAVDFSVREEEAKKRAIVLTVHPPADAAKDPDLQELRRLLGISGEQFEIPVSVGLLRPKQDELSLYTFSLFQMLAAQGRNVDMPEGTGMPAAASQDTHSPVIAIHRGNKRPTNAAVAIPYTGGWYWIDRDDLASRGTLMALVILYRLLESGTPGNLPVLTIPAG